VRSLKRVFLFTWFALAIASPAARAQGSGTFANVSQCYINGTFVTVQGNCPAANSPSAAKPAAGTSPNAGLSQAGYQLGYAFGQWLFGGNSNPQAALQKQLMMQELARREAEAERLRQEEEARRIAALFNRLNATLKLSGLPDLHSKDTGSVPGLSLKLGGDADAQTGINGLPGIYLHDQDKPYGIPGLPGLYTGGPGEGSRLSVPKAQAAAVSEAATAPTLPPTETGLQLKTGGDGATSATAPAASAPPPPPTFDPSKMTPQQLADAAEAFSKLPPEEQQRLLAQAQNDAGQTAAAVRGEPSVPTTAVSQVEAQPGGPDLSPASPNTPPPGAAQATPPLNPQSTTGQVQAVARASQSAAQAPTPEDASAKARTGFDQPLGLGQIKLGGDNLAPAAAAEPVSVTARPTALATPTPAPVNPPSSSERLATIGRIDALAQNLGWAPDKLQLLDHALKALNADGDPHATNIAIRIAWQQVLERGQNPELAQLAAQHGGLGIPGAGTQTDHQDCAVFAVANATGLPYGVVAMRAAEIIHQAEWRSASERAHPQDTIEQRGLTGGEVIMLAESFGQAEVVPSQDFAKTLNQGRPIMINVVPPNGNVNAGHEVVLTKTFQRGSETWFEVMDSNRGPVCRLFMSSKDLITILQENGVAFRPDAGTTPQLLRDRQ